MQKKKDATTAAHPSNIDSTYHCPGLSTEGIYVGIPLSNQSARKDQVKKKATTRNQQV